MKSRCFLKAGEHEGAAGLWEGLLWAVPSGCVWSPAVPAGSSPTAAPVLLPSPALLPDTWASPTDPAKSSRQGPCRVSGVAGKGQCGRDTALRGDVSYGVSASPRLLLTTATATARDVTALTHPEPGKHGGKATEKGQGATALLRRNKVT